MTKEVVLMKNRMSLLLMILACLAAPLAAADYQRSIPVADRAEELGVGVMAGNPTGFTAKYWFDRQWAADLEVGLPSGQAVGVGGSLDLVFHKYYIFGKHNIFSYNCPLYFGGGVWGLRWNQVNGKDNTNALDMSGVRGVAGLTFLFPRHPFDAFVEWAPSVQCSPSFGTPALDGFVAGARYYFGSSGRKR